MSWTREFKVGITGIIAIAFAVLFSIATDDRPIGASEGYVLYADFPSVEGVYVSTQVRIAGVSVGSVRGVDLNGTTGRLTFEMTGDVELHEDSVAQLVGSGVLGDKTITIVPGTDGRILTDGDVIKTQVTGLAALDTDALAARADKISADVEAITGSLKELLADEEFKAGITGTVANVNQLSADVKDLAEANRAQIDAVVANLQEVSKTLKAVSESSSQTVEAQLAVIEKTLATLDRTANDIEEIVAKVERGEGTVGALLTDDGPVRQMEQTLDEVNKLLVEANDVVGSVNNMGTEIYYDGRYYFGSQPSASSALNANPVAGGARNALGIRIMPREDYWYLIELVDHPLGSISTTEFSYPDLGSAYRQYVRTQSFRFTAQFARRFGPVAFRLGLKDSAGGVGADAWAWQDRIQVSADLYDFTFGSWPALDGTPNLNVGVSIEPYPHVFVQAGVHNVLLGARHGYYTGYVGGGIRFTDDDFRWVLATLPSPL
ncbi:MAG: MCE family protein [Alphaproteobacteria bacterium]|nr:MCE family protein [Alphaproteobacteria bacterium]